MPKLINFKSKTAIPSHYVVGGRQSHQNHDNTLLNGLYWDQIKLKLHIDIHPVVGFYAWNKFDKEGNIEDLLTPLRVE